LGIVGESGCGKSVTVLSILQLIPTPPGKVVSGEAIFGAQDLLKLSGREIRKIAGKDISMIFQDPMISFNPVMTIGKQIAEPLEFHLGLSRKDASMRALELLKMVGIPNARSRLDDYPHQFSGGMRQRAMIAMALTCSPQILIADEPTTALDVTIQAQILKLVKQLRDELGMSMIWITHDLGIVAGLVQRVLIMYAGEIIEQAEVNELYANPQHPYTISLLKCLPRLDEDERRDLATIEGLPPRLLEKPLGCSFAARCPFTLNQCWTEHPPQFETSSRHYVSCWVDPRTGRGRE
jgi:oligopeptide transport system ATP-binding protein